MAQEINSINKFYRRLVAIFVGGLVMTMVIFLAVIPLLEYADKPAYLDVLVTPNEAKVMIDGVEYRNAVYELEPGVYTATITLSDLTPEVVEFELTKDATTGLYAEWFEGGGWKYYTAEELAHKNGIKEILPISLSICGTPAKRTNCDAIEINYDRAPECQSQECIVINGRRAEMMDEVLSAVRDKLSENGYNLDDYRYVYIQNDER